jgi:hypothetical protein
VECLCHAAVRVSVYTLVVFFVLYHFDSPREYLWFI